MTGTLLIGNFLSGSLGNRGVCEDLAEGLRGRGRPLITASSRPRRAARLLDMLSTTWRARRRYAVAQVDVFSGPSFRWAEAVCGLLRRQRCPYILTLHGGALPVFAQRHPERVRRLLGKAHAVTAPSQYLVRTLAWVRPDIIWLPNSIDVSRFQFRERSQPCPRLVWLRAFHRIYNPVLAVRAIAELRPEFPAIELVMYGADRGDGTLRKVRDAVKALGLVHCVHIEKAIPSRGVPDRLAASDIFLNTSSVDNAPVSLVEAMACGLAVVSTDVGGIPHLVEHEREALLVSPDNPDAMASAVRRILATPGLATRLSANARKSAEQFDREHILSRWEELLDRVQWSN